MPKIKPSKLKNPSSNYQPTNLLSNYQLRNTSSNSRSTNPSSNSRPRNSQLINPSSNSQLTRELRDLMNGQLSAFHIANIDAQNNQARMQAEQARMQAEQARIEARKNVIKQAEQEATIIVLRQINDPQYADDESIITVKDEILSEIDKQISTRKNSTTQWSELAIASLFVTSDVEMKSIRSKDDFEALVQTAIRTNKLYCSSIESYIKDLRSETNFQKIKTYIDNFVLPSGFNGNEILKVWLVGQNIPNNIEPHSWNIGVQKRDKRSDFYGVARNPLYEGHISVTFNREEVYPFGFDVKSTDKDYICNIAASGYSDPKDSELWKTIYRETISSLLSVEGTSTIGRDVANSEFRDKSHPYWEFFEILSSEPSFAQGITRSVFSMNVLYPVFFYDGTKVVNLHKLASEIDLSESQITIDSDRNASSEAAKYFYSLENYNNGGQLISKHRGECRLKNPSVITSTTSIYAQSMLQGFYVDPQFIETNYRGGGSASVSSSSGGGADNSISNATNIEYKRNTNLSENNPFNGKSGGRKMPGGSHKRKTLKKRKTRRRK